MGADLPFLLVHGGVVGSVLLGVAVIAAALLGPTLASSLLGGRRDRRLERLGKPLRPADVAIGSELVVSGTLLPCSKPTSRHGDGAPVAVSVAARRAKQERRRADRIALSTEQGLVLVRGPVELEVGSANESTRDATVATAVLQKYVPRVWLPSSVRSVAEGDPVLLRGRLVRFRPRAAGNVAVVDGAELVYTGPLRAPATPRARLSHALFAALALLAFAAALGWGGLWLAKSSPTFALRWTGVLAASITPFRARALAAAEDLLALELVAVFPEPDHPSQYYRTRAGVGGEQAARYVALSRLRKDCEKAAERLSSLSVLHADLSDAAAERLLECEQPLELARIAEARFWESDFETASRLYDRAAIVWGKTDEESPYSASLIALHVKKELFSHWLAGKFDAALRTLDRLRDSATSARLECVRLSLAVVSNQPNALARLTERSAQCPVHLAAFAPKRRAELAKLKDGNAHVTYLYQAWTLELEPLLAPDAKFSEASRVSSYARIETPHELLSFPHGTRDLDPAIVFELLARLQAEAKPTPAQRLIRARLAAVAATLDSLLGEPAKARRWMSLVRSDFAALLALAPDGGERSPSSYDHDRLELESRYARLLEVGVELQAGQVDAAERLSREIPELAAQEDKSWLESDVKDLAAATELVRGYIELWRGKPERIQRFAGSELCNELSGCFIVRGNLEAYLKAARGDSQGCEENACLISARSPIARERLGARIDEVAGMAAVTDNPLDRLYRIGEMRRLCQAIGDGERLARFDAWYEKVRPVALDARLSVARRTLEQFN